MIGDWLAESGSAGAGAEGAGNMATSSALAVDRSLRGLLSEGTRSEFREVHQVPKGRRCIRAYFLVWYRCACFSVGGGGLDSAVLDRSKRSVSMSRGSGTEWKEAWSRSDDARLQKRSCCAAGEEARDLGW